MDLMQLLTAFGVGSIVSIAVQAFLTQRADKVKRDFQEKKEAYVGLLEAYRKACDEGDQGKEFGYWSVRCALVASKEIRNLIEEMKTSDLEKQEQIFKGLQEAIRKDLGVTKS